MESPDAPNNLIRYVEALCARYGLEPVDEEQVQNIIAETGLPIKTSWSELGRHLANIRLIVSYRYKAPKQKDQAEEDQKALSEVQKLRMSLTNKLKSLKDSESPLSRAFRRAAFLAAAADAPLSLSLTRASD